jgi:hypothetical protein
VSLVVIEGRHQRLPLCHQRKKTRTANFTNRREPSIESSQLLWVQSSSWSIRFSVRPSTTSVPIWHVA